MWNFWERDPRALRRAQPHFGPALGPSGTTGRVHFPPPPHDIPASTAGDVSASQAAPSAPPPLHTAVVAQRNTQTGGNGYLPPPPPFTVLTMLRSAPVRLEARAFGPEAG